MGYFGMFNLAACLKNKLRAARRQNLYRLVQRMGGKAISIVRGERQSYRDFLMIISREPYRALEFLWLRV
ncbi:hypothetical protein MNBD_GAMMA09-1597 [hydrothermal vent metagenome]|uniref:Uncharacterized protein n=1 Tax=hydrothermal vent metagenome TaxID=652676 RepID=A0A3B0YP72_9ZZZZ